MILAILWHVTYLSGMSYEPHEHLVTPARTNPEVWRLAIGIVTALTVYYLGVLAYAKIAIRLAGYDVSERAFTGEHSGPAEVYLLMGSFALMVAGILVAAAIHQRGLRDLLGGYRRTFVSFLNSLIALVPIVAIIAVLSCMLIDGITSNVPLTTWTVLLPVSLLLLLLQVGAEELVFRGYLQSQLAALNLPTPIWMLIPSVLFGLAHYDPETMGAAAPWLVVWATVFGLLAADLTARTGTLGPAIAMHFANNFSALLIFGFTDYLGGLSLFTLPYSVSDTDAIMGQLPYDAAGMVLLYLAIRLRLKV